MTDPREETAFTNVTVQRGVPATMRDGAVLRSDIFRPTEPGRYPVLLCRTPYDKAGPLYATDAPAMASRGYIVVVQDSRGRYESEGEFQWIFGFPGHEVEARDGYDSVEWAATLDGSTGKVGMWGTSYPSGLAFRTAGTQPPSLGALFPTGMGDKHQNMCFGIFETGRRLQWTFSMAADARRRAGDPFAPQTRAEATDIWNRVDRGKWLWKLPLETIPEEFASTLTPQLQAYFREVQCEFWDFPAIHDKVNVPMKAGTGWWDRLVYTVDNYTGIVEKAPSSLRDQHRLVIGPWGHQTHEWFGDLGPRDYGDNGTVSYPGMAADWFDRHLKDIDNTSPDEKAVDVFVVNDNEWRGYSSWPLEGTSYTPFFLDSRGAANGVAGDGSLVRDPVSSEPDRYVYDPADPVMSLMALDSQALPCDQSPLDRRKDILVYQSPPLERDTLTIGPVICHLWAASNCPDTDFTVKLVEVGADGLAINLSSGVVRARYRFGYDRQVMLDSDVPQEYVIKMMPVGIRFRKGSRIRLDVGSADFPNYDRNHNTGRDYWSDPELRVAKQTVFHDDAMPSRVILPIIED